ncbi:N-acetylmuramoyl-L-alanine amidase [Haloechinothrix sp. YIM 98757]|uniref:N-acetylmuramoyl-L-alanine amidase n=1 Tax=Haloechinothrix aidingensis TaxID=2752311 RepID=A0A838AF24_9PSEU|nr:N-acetylmuramoyl-L-alanine amidase [Haloechinothrix aidingensis]MBA0127853.1 N-acetylmuramoyl-L-alanine amidase [Haloechinothrix aidingensis]
MGTGARRTRRWVLRGGLTATAVGATALQVPAASTAGTTAREPAVYTTTHWEAREPAEPVPVLDHPPTYIVVHHTVKPNSSTDTSRGSAFEISRAIQNFHMDGRGWIDTGQQFTASKGGYLTEGRHRSLEVVRRGRQHVHGTNVAEHNHEVVGIECEGDYRDEDVPEPLWDALSDLVTYIAYRYDIAPELIKGHRDFSSTQCPGDVLYARLDELRQEVGDRLGKPVGSQTEWPLLRPGDQGEDVRTAQRLLRARGARDVQPHGIFDSATRDAVADLAREHGTLDRSCCGSAHADELGMLGADLWPKLVTDQRSTVGWKDHLARLVPRSR